jgi:hypothetical protein
VGFGINGWDVVRDNNGAKSFGGQLTLLPAADLSVTATYLGGAERPGDDSTLRHLGDIVVTYKPFERVTLAVNGDYARDGGQRWYGVAGYLRADLGSRLALGVRGETFHDRDGARTGTARTLREATATAAFRLAASFVFRLELRYDHATTAAFEAIGGARSSQLTAAANALYAL